MQLSLTTYKVLENSPGSHFNEKKAKHWKIAFKKGNSAATKTSEQKTNFVLYAILFYLFFIFEAGEYLVWVLPANDNCFA